MSHLVDIHGQHAHQSLLRAASQRELLDRQKWKTRAELASAISAASRAIDNHTNRQFGKVAAPEEREYTARPNYERDFSASINAGNTLVTSPTIPRSAIDRMGAWSSLLTRPR